RAVDPRGVVQVAAARLMALEHLAVAEVAQGPQQTARVPTDTVGALGGAAVEGDFHGCPDDARWSGTRTLTNVRPEMSLDRRTEAGARYGRAIKDYYEDLWERLPDELEPPSFERRLAFLRGKLRAGDRALDLGSGAGEFTAAM